MKKKLRLYKATATSVFASEDTLKLSLIGLQNDAAEGLCDAVPEITEIASYKDIPEGWDNDEVLVWNADGLTARQFLDAQKKEEQKQKKITTDPEYRQYLRLKEKFKNIDN